LPSFCQGEMRFQCRNRQLVTLLNFITRTLHDALPILELLVMYTGLEHLQMGRCQTALQPVGGKGAQRHAGHPEERRQGQMDATHEPDSSSVRSMKAPMMPRRLPHFLRRLLQRLLLLALGLLALSVALVLVLRW